MAMLLASALAGLGEGVLEGKQMRRQRDLQDEERAARKEDQAWEKENRDYTRTERAKAPLRDTYTRLSDPEYTSSMALPESSGIYTTRVPWRTSFRLSTRNNRTAVFRII